jgi:hypothetical protein
MNKIKSVDIGMFLQFHDIIMTNELIKSIIMNKKIKATNIY